MRFNAGLALAVALAVWSCGDRRATPTPSSSPAPSPSLPVSEPQGWAMLAGSPVSPGTSRHDDLVFIDAATGWLINVRGEVHRTQDGGATWEALSHFPPAVFPRCVGFASPARGWIGTLNVTAGQIQPDTALWETEDGGRTWSNISTRLQGAAVIGLCGLRVVTPATVMAVGRWCGPPVFVKTIDGGRTWTSRSLAPLVSGIVDLFFLNEREGFAVGGLGVGISEAEQRASRTVILATTDGGETWQTRYLSTDVGQWAWKIQFITERIGYVTTEGPSPEGAILKTTDGGSSWRPMMVDPGVPFQAVAFVSPDRGWVGSFPTLYSTVDGGATWKALAFGTRVNRMRVLSESLVFGSGDRVYRWTP